MIERSSNVSSSDVIEGLRFRSKLFDIADVLRACALLQRRDGLCALALFSSETPLPPRERWPLPFLKRSDW